MYNDEFLKNLSYELNTQDTDGNADPVFWMIRDYKDISNANGQYIAILDECEVIFREYEDDLDELKEYINERFDLEDNIDDLNLTELVDYIESVGLELDISRYDKVPYITELSGCFLTKKAAQKHIEENRHHYTANVHTYAMTAWRNPEFEDLINIIKEYK